jgi:hypothetical protein
VQDACHALVCIINQSMDTCHAKIIAQEGPPTQDSVHAHQYWQRLRGLVFTMGYII